MPPSQFVSVSIKALQERVRRLENARRPDWKIVSSGSAALDRLLPDRGFRRGTIVDWLGQKGSGAAALAIVAAREACREGAALLVIDAASDYAGSGYAGSGFYPPAAASLGIDLARTVFVRPRNQADHRWAMNQALRCSGAGAVLAWPQRLDAQTFRRWQLAAETGGALGLLLRSPNVRGQPTWADIQLFVEPLPASSAAAGTPRRLRVEIVRCRGGKSGGTVELELDDETGTLQPAHALPLASPMAVAAGA